MGTYNPHNHSMLVRADARALGAVTALSTTYRRKPRTYVAALTPCVSNVQGIMGGRSGSKPTLGNVPSLTPPAKVLTHVRAHALRGRITDYIRVAQRVGLDPANVARLYRERDTSGYCATLASVALNTNDLAERRI